jgi:hypothetical protein
VAAPPGIGGRRELRLAAAAQWSGGRLGQKFIFRDNCTTLTEESNPRKLP